MSEQKQEQSETPAETPATPAELSGDELDAVVGGIAAPAVPGVHVHPTAPGQQKGIIAILIG